MKKSPSLPTVTNKNVMFIDNPISWVFYTLLFLTIRIIFSGMGISAAFAWTLTNWIHGVISFVCFHWIKGSPFIEDHGEFTHLTFWEQIDDQMQYTRARKFLAAFPLILFVIALDEGAWELAYVWLNLPITVIVMIAKLPFMHGVRIFGING